jgi:integrase
LRANHEQYEKALRHTYGSQLLSEGIPLPAVSKLLGHSSVHTTANVYSHSLSKDEQAAASVWDAIAKKAKLS